MNYLRKRVKCPFCHKIYQIEKKWIAVECPYCLQWNHNISATFVGYVFKKDIKDVKCPFCNHEYYIRKEWTTAKCPHCLREYNNTS